MLIIHSPAPKVNCIQSGRREHSVGNGRRPWRSRVDAQVRKVHLPMDMFRTPAPRWPSSTRTVMTQVQPLIAVLRVGGAVNSSGA